VFGSRVLRRVFGPKREEIARDWRKLHNEELRNLKSSPHIIRVIKSKIMSSVKHIALLIEMKIDKILSGREEQFSKYKPWWENNIEMELNRNGL
jgi:hypothetical protein